MQSLLSFFAIFAVLTLPSPLDMIYVFAAWGSKAALFGKLPFLGRRPQPPDVIETSLPSDLLSLQHPLVI